MNIAESKIRLIECLINKSRGIITDGSIANGGVDFLVQAVDIVKELPETEDIQEKTAKKLARHFLRDFTYLPEEIVRLSEFIKDKDGLANEAVNYYRKLHGDGTIHDLQLYICLHQISFVFSDEKKKKGLLEEALLFMLSNRYIEYAVDIATALKGGLDNNEIQQLLEFSDLDRVETLTCYFKRGLMASEILILALNSLEKLKKRKEKTTICCADADYEDFIKRTLSFFRKSSKEKTFFYEKFLSLCVEKGAFKSAVIVSSILGRKLSTKELEHLFEKTLEGGETGYASQLLTLLSKSDSNKPETVSKISFWQRISRR